MEPIVIFALGILTGTYLSLGLSFILIPHRNAPYHQAFGYEMSMGAVILSLEAALYWVTGKTYNEQTTLYLGIDTMIIPFFMMEVDSIANQDLIARPWKQRWATLGWLETPLIVLTLASYLSDWEYEYLTMGIVSVSYLAFLLSYMAREFRKYHHLLNKDSKGKQEKVTWVWFILMLYTIQLVFYVFTSESELLLCYCVVSLVAVLLHGFFISRQSPVDTRHQIELIQAQQHALEEFEEITKDLKKQVDMDATIKAFEIKHPGFSAKLRAMTETRLTKRDIYLCVLIGEGKKNQEMANRLGISASSVDVARHRLRAKLNMGKGDNLHALLISLL